MSCGNLPVILLPGLNGDSRVFVEQRASIPSLRIARWLAPLPQETIGHYARRMAAAIDPGRPCIVGGVSFGGIVALEVARHLRATGCVLIASSRDIAGLPTSLRLMRPFGRLLALPVVQQAVLEASAAWRPEPEVVVG